MGGGRLGARVDGKHKERFAVDILQVVVVVAH